MRSSRAVCSVAICTLANVDPLNWLPESVVLKLPSGAYSHWHMGKKIKKDQGVSSFILLFSSAWKKNLLRESAIVVPFPQHLHEKVSSKAQVVFLEVQKKLEEVSFCWIIRADTLLCTWRRNQPRWRVWFVPRRSDRRDNMLLTDCLLLLCVCVCKHVFLMKRETMEKLKNVSSIINHTRFFFFYQGTFPFSFPFCLRIITMWLQFANA